MPSKSIRSARVHARPVFAALVATLACALAPGLGSRADADQLFPLGSHATGVAESFYVFGETKGGDEINVKFRAFGETFEVPRVKAGMVAQPRQRDAEIEAALVLEGNPDAWCDAAQAYLLIGDSGAAEERFELAYAADPNHPRAAAGALRGSISDLMDDAAKLLESSDKVWLKGEAAPAGGINNDPDAVVDWDAVLAPFEPFAVGAAVSSRVVAEYWVVTVLRIVEEATGRDGDKLSESMWSVLVKTRKKAISMIGSKSDDHVELDALVGVCRALYDEPSSWLALTVAKKTDELAVRARICEALIARWGEPELFEPVRTAVLAMLVETLPPWFVRKNDKAFANAAGTIRDANAALDAEAISDDERRLVVAGNDYREALGAQRLRVNDALMEAARAHSADMNENNYFSHTGLDRSTPSKRATAAGFPPRSLVGENIYRGSEGDDVVDAVLFGWIRSPSHHLNLCLGEHSMIGVGNAGAYWTQLLGRPDE